MIIDEKTMLEVVVATVIGTVFGGLILALIAIGWRKGALPRVLQWWGWLERRRRERDIKQLKKAVAKKLQSENTPWGIDSWSYDTALGEAHHDRLVAFSNVQIDTRITPSDYKIARALESLVAERRLHKVRQGPLWGNLGERPRYIFSYHPGSEASYDAEQQRLVLEADCVEHIAHMQGSPNACPNPRYVRYNASNQPGKIREAIKKLEDGPEHCARCWEMRRYAS